MKSKESIERLPTVRVIKLIVALYEYLSLAPIIMYASKRYGFDRAAITDAFVLGRMLVGFGLLFIPWSTVRILVAALLIYDIVIAHAAHLFDDKVGSAGPGARWSTGRSLLIALLNITILGILFAGIYRSLDGLSLFQALSTSWSMLTTLGFEQPSSNIAKAVGLFQGSTTLFMIAVVLSTVVAGFPERSDRLRSK